MNTLPLTIVRNRVEGAVLAGCLLALSASCGDTPVPPDVDLSPPADGGVVEPDARAHQSGEQPCDTPQCMQFGGGQPPLPPTTFRRIVCDQATAKSP